MSLVDIDNRMVSIRRMLNAVFAALADPTRRAIVSRLAREDGLLVNEIAKPFPMSLPAVIKHLDVLADAGLVKRKRIGRTTQCRLAAGPMGEAVDWLERHQRFWNARLDALGSLVNRRKQ